VEADDRGLGWQSLRGMPVIIPFVVKFPVYGTFGNGLGFGAVIRLITDRRSVVEHRGLDGVSGARSCHFSIRKSVDWDLRYNGPDVTRHIL
jgi:hypothetical protein